MLAARRSRDWKDFARTGSRIYGRDEKDQSKRVRRYLMVANALRVNDAENGLAKKPGKEPLKNSWAMGPFYQWDANFK